jgi:hypothetical protein
MIFKALFFISFFVGSSVVHGQKIITDRPDQTESSSTVPKKSLQIESGMLLQFAEEGDVSLREIAIPTTLFRYGAGKGIEIRVANQFLDIKEKGTSNQISGISDLEIGAKIQLYKKENSKTEIAFLSHLILPTGTREVSLEKLGTINKLSVSHELTDHIGLGYNLGYNYFGFENGFFTYSFVIGIGITESVCMYVEPYGSIGIFDEHLANIDAGITYLVQDNFQLDFSFGTGINYTMNYLSAGFSWNIAPKSDGDF